MRGEICLVSADAIHVTVASEPGIGLVIYLKVIVHDQQIALTFRRMNQKPQAMLLRPPLGRLFLPRRWVPRLLLTALFLSQTSRPHVGVPCITLRRGCAQATTPYCS